MLKPLPVLVLTAALLAPAFPAVADEALAPATAPAATATAETADDKKEGGLQDTINDAFGDVNGAIAPVLFFDVAFGQIEKDGEVVAIPLIVVILLLGGVFFTFRFGLINLRLFGHSLQVIRGKYDDPRDHGEVSHFQALTAALSATVGLGNIAGVALAISGGGPGAVFWMWVVAFFGMSSKFSSCTLAQLYRKVEDKDPKLGREHVLGGPMLYLQRGMVEMLGKGFGLPFGKLLAVSFAFFAIMGSLGGGNMFQSNQTAAIFSFVLLDGDTSHSWVFGLLMAGLVALVIVGGIRRIGDVTSKLVPTMCVFYVAVCLAIVIVNAEHVPALLGEIFDQAFNWKAAGWGGLAAILVTGVTRGAFSNEAGLGSAAIAHSAAKTSEPVREGVVAMIGPFIDTIVVCTMTALTILITRNLYSPDELLGAEGWVKGAAMTAAAFGTLHGWMPLLLCVAVFIFAYSTMISWSYYGERACEYLFGRAAIWPYRVVFLIFVVIGPLLSVNNVLDFTDLLILSMAYPNIVGMVILSPIVARAAKDYVSRLRSGSMKTRDQLKAEAEGEPSI